MCLTKRTCTDCDILDSHIVDLFHDHIYNIVTITEMMMETNGHSVFYSTFFQDVANVIHKFASIGVDNTLCHRSLFSIFISIKMMCSLKYFFSCCFQNLFRNVSSNCINHLINPPCTRLRLLPD